MSEENYQIIATLAAKAAVHEFVNGPAFETAIERTIDTALAKCGLDTENPDEMRLDMAHVRRGRRRAELVESKGIGATVTAFVGFMFLVIGAGVTALILK